MSEEKKEELTPEQIEENRKKVIQYYKKQIEVLEFQAKYEELMASIEISRANRLEMIIRQAQMTAPPEDPTKKGTETSGQETDGKKERPLKKS